MRRVELGSAVTVPGTPLNVAWLSESTVAKLKPSMTTGAVPATPRAGVMPDTTTILTKLTVAAVEADALTGTTVKVASASGNVTESAATETTQASAPTFVEVNAPAYRPVAPAAAESGCVHAAPSTARPATGGPLHATVKARP